MNQNVLIRNSKLKIANGNHSTLNIAVGFNSQLTNSESQA